MSAPSVHYFLEAAFLANAIPEYREFLDGRLNEHWVSNMNEFANNLGRCIKLRGNEYRTSRNRWPKRSNLEPILHFQYNFGKLSNPEHPDRNPDKSYGTQLSRCLYQAVS